MAFEDFTDGEWKVNSTRCRECMCDQIDIGGEEEEVLVECRSNNTHEYEVGRYQPDPCDPKGPGTIVGPGDAPSYIITITPATGGCPAQITCEIFRNVKGAETGSWTANDTSGNEG
jgi:hypothetical protein